MSLAPTLDPDLSSFLERRVARSGVATHVAAGVAWKTASGWSASWAAAGAADVTTPFDLASVSKSFFATLVSWLVEDGRLSWTTKLADLLPELGGTPGGDATLEALLSHRTGLVAHVELFRGAFLGAPFRRADELARAARSLGAHDGALYSDLGYLLVGEGVARVLGRELDELLDEMVTRSLALDVGSSRCWQRDPHFFERVAPTELEPLRGGVVRGLVHDDNAWVFGGSGACGHAGLFGTLGGVLDFGVALVDGVHGEGALSRVVEPLVRKRPGGTLRLGFDGISGPTSLAGRLASASTFGHLGFTGTSLWCDPERSAVTVLLTNRVHPTRKNPLLRAARPEVHDWLWTHADRALSLSARVPPRPAVAP